MLEESAKNAQESSCSFDCDKDELWKNKDPDEYLDLKEALTPIRKVSNSYQEESKSYELETGGSCTLKFPDEELSG